MLLSGRLPSSSLLVAATPRFKETAEHRNARRDRQVARGLVAAANLGYPVDLEVLSEAHSKLASHHGTSPMACPPCGMQLFDAWGHPVTQPGWVQKGKGKGKKGSGKGTHPGKGAGQAGPLSTVVCTHCGKNGHTVDVCRSKAREAKACTYCQSLGLAGLGHLEAECRKRKPPPVLAPGAVSRATLRRSASRKSMSASSAARRGTQQLPAGT